MKGWVCRLLCFFSQMGTFQFFGNDKYCRWQAYSRLPFLVKNSIFISLIRIKLKLIHRIHKWRTRGKKLVPNHESGALRDKQKLQMKTFSELAECLARFPPKITLYGRLFKYDYVGRLLLLMFSTDLLFEIKRDAYIFKEPGWFCRFPKHQKLDKWAMAGEKRQTCWPKLHAETEYESQLTAIL